MKNLIRIYKLGLILFLFWQSSVFSQPEFVQHIVTTEFTNGFDVIAEDLNKDSYPDIIGCAKTSVGEVSWWKNDGTNQFNKILIKEGFQGARSVRAKDLNGDNEIDLVAAAWQANTIIFFKNDGNENFTEYVVDDDFKGAHTVDLKDVNHDGLIDILCSGFDYYGHEGEIAWWENDGLTPIGWTKHLISDRFQQSPFIYGEDMDGDEDLDVIACGELNDEILWWENNGSGDFIGEHMVDSLFNAAHTVIARDVDLDGDMDILGAACVSSLLAWYENNGSQQFIKHPLPQYAGALWLDGIDVDNDNDIDLFGAGMSENKLNWWENNGNQDFIKKNIDDIFTQGFSIVPIMMDNDDDVDFVAIGKGSHTISWFENKLVDPIVFNHPECCVYDYEQNRWLISNTGGVDDPGNIIEINEEGDYSIWKNNMVDPLGMCIADGILYVSEANSGVYGFDLINGEEVFFKAFNTIGNIDGQAYDNDGHLFIVDTGGKIYKIYLSTEEVTEFVASGLTSWTQDIVYDAFNNRLLAIGYAINAPIQAISLQDSSITNYATNYSYYDGITIDQFGNVYLASHQSPGRIVRYFYGLNGDFDILSTGHDEPAGLHYNIESNVLAVPNYGGSTVDFLQVTMTSNSFSIENTHNQIEIYPNPFKDNVSINFHSESTLEFTFKIYDTNGKLVRNKRCISNHDVNKTIIWDGKNNSGKGVPNGIYFVNINSDDLIIINKIIKHQ